MKTGGYIVSLFLFFLTLERCVIPDVPNFKNQVLQGTVKYNSYIFQSGFASTNMFDTSLWTLHLLNKPAQGDIDPWEAGAYDGYSDLIEVYFSIKKISQPKLYEIVTLVGNYEETIAVFGLVSATGQGTIFDKGYLEITEINFDAGIISGRIDADVFDSLEGSELNGNFTVPIQPGEF